MAGNVVYVETYRTKATILKAHGPLRQTDVTIDYLDELYNQKKNSFVECEIERVWKSKTELNSQLYNASKFRLKQCQYEGGKLYMKLGLTSYKDLCGTNLSGNVQRLINDGLRDYDDEQSYLSQTLGVGVLLITADGHLPLLRRASWTGESPGKWDRPGGHPEPQHLLPGCSNDDIFQEVWGAACSEAVSECGLPSAALPPSALLLVGVSRQTEAGGRPSLEYVARLPLTAALLHKSYSRGLHSEASESTALLLLPPATVAALIAAVRAAYSLRGDGLEAPISGQRTTENCVMATDDDSVSQGEEEDQTCSCVRSLVEEAAKAAVGSCTPALIGALLLGEELLLQWFGTVPGVVTTEPPR